MDFSGKWQIHSHENHEEFLKQMAVPEMLVKMMKDVKPVIVIEQNGEDFTISIQTSIRTLTNSFSVGKETEITTLDGMKFKCTSRLEGGKLICDMKKFTHMFEIQGEEMVETLTAGSTTMTRRSKRI